MKKYFLILMSLAWWGSVWADTEEKKSSAQPKEVYNPTSMILHHIADANEFEIVHGVSVPLPCILYNITTKKWSFFMSNDHEAMQAAGYHLHQGRVKPLREEEKMLDLSITKNVFGMLFASLLLSVVFFSMKSAYEKRKHQAPKGLQSLLEPIVILVRDYIARQALGNKADDYLPYLMTVFFFILFNNLLGLIPIFPGSANVTGNISVTLVLALISGIIINVKANKYYWKHIFLPQPIWMAPLLVPVELLGVITKPITLMIRLFANITAGHIIVLSLISLIFVFRSIWGTVGVGLGTLVAVPFTLFISVIELLVAFIQAFIFTMLSAVFIGMAIEEHHGHGAH
jgi:F-type H+-transporting ATPase subunit a